MGKISSQIEKGISYNEKFWDFLNYYLGIEFKKINYNFEFIYPLRGENNFIFTKNKVCDFVIIESVIVSNEEGREVVYTKMNNI